ncbi:MAG: hypothetical protein WBM13_08080 [Bacteroidia bacterium]
MKRIIIILILGFIWLAWIYNEAHTSSYGIYHTINVGEFMYSLLFILLSFITIIWILIIDIKEATKSNKIINFIPTLFNVFFIITCFCIFNYYRNIELSPSLIDGRPVFDEKIEKVDRVFEGFYINFKRNGSYSITSLSDQSIYFGKKYTFNRGIFQLDKPFNFFYVETYKPFKFRSIKTDKILIKVFRDKIRKLEGGLKDTLWFADFFLIDSSENVIDCNLYFTSDTISSYYGSY